MKIGNQSFDKPEPMEVKVPFGDKTFTLKVQAVMDYTDFEALVPIPSPPKVLDVKNNQEVFDTKDKKYLAAVNVYAKTKTSFMVMRSLEATEDLTWDTVDKDKPDTWHRVENELRKAFTEFGMQKIQKSILQVNGLGEEILEQARQSFLAFQSRQSA